MKTYFKNLLMQSIGVSVAITIIFAFLLNFIPALSNAQSDPPDYVEHVEAIGLMVEQSTSTIYDGVRTVVKDLAAALEQPAGHVYEILIKQQIVQSIGYLLIVIVLFAPMFLWPYFRRLCADHSDPYNNGWLFPLVVIPIIAIVGVGVFGSEANIIITGFFNPEYGAIKEIVSLIK